MSDCNACLKHFVSSGYFIAYHPKIIKIIFPDRSGPACLKVGLRTSHRNGSYLFVSAAPCDVIQVRMPHN